MRFLSLALLLSACGTDPQTAPADVPLDDRTADGPALDVAITDAPTADATSDASSPEAAVDVAVTDAPARDAADAAPDVSDAPAEAASVDASTDAATAAPVMCSERPLRCTTNADCAVCVRSAEGFPFCCRTTNNECAVQIGHAVCE